MTVSNVVIGENLPPRYGDYEAQRHWMEISFNLPPSQWYYNSTNNNLAYWGLDYPPLSGYLSYAFAKVLNLIEPQMVALHSSQGFESGFSRVLMRGTVLICDLLLLFPAAVLIFSHFDRGQQQHLKPMATIVPQLSFFLSMPALILIDHAHFQYNNVSLGLFLLSVVSFASSQYFFGAVLYCLTVFFKHMTLYYVLAIFSFLASHLIRFTCHSEFKRSVSMVFHVFLGIFIAVIFSFAPWLTSKDHLLQIVRRLFPLSRGLYEDKVANVWCSISVILKLGRLLPREKLFAFCAGVTVLASLPFCIAVAMKPSPRRLVLACAGCSLSAFLFSYQVHEKQILMPLTAFALLYDSYPFLSIWVSFACTFSLFPLILKEQSVTAYIALLIVHLAIILLLCSDTSSTIHVHSSTRNTPDSVPEQRDEMEIPPILWYQDKGRRHRFVVISSLTGIILNMALVFLTAPARAPDLITLMNTSYACLHFCLIYLVAAVVSFRC